MAGFNFLRYHRIAFPVRVPIPSHYRVYVYNISKDSCQFIMVQYLIVFSSLVCSTVTVTPETLHFEVCLGYAVLSLQCPYYNCPIAYGFATSLLEL